MKNTLLFTVQYKHSGTFANRKCATPFKKSIENATPL